MKKARRDIRRFAACPASASPARTRLSDPALTNIDLIDRNLYERSCDCRWWAADAAMVSALAEPGTEPPDTPASGSG